MIHRNDMSGRFLTELLVVLLTVPLGIAVHHHEAAHDGGVPHLEVPHGGHDSPAPELYERLTSPGPEGPASPTPVRHPAMSIDLVVAVEVVAPEHPDHPPRPPPVPALSRAPPIGF